MSMVKLRKKKNQPRLLDRGWHVESVVLFIRQLAHRLQISPVRSLRKEEAVRKGEVEKCTSAIHDRG